MMASETVTCRSFLNQLNEQNITKLLAIMQNLYVVWEDAGIDEEQEIDRATKVWNCVFDLLSKIECEEVSLIEEIKERVINYEKKISVLNVELQLPNVEKASGSLIQVEQTLRQSLNELSKMKHKRIKEFQELRSQELKYCKVLELSPLSTSFSSKTRIPSEKDINELQQQVKILKEEKEKRQQEFFNLKKELSTILEVTELTPETSFEKEILTHQEETLSLSVAKLRQLEQIVTKTKKKQADLENEIFCLIEKLFILWDNLDIDTKEKEIFLSKHTDCHISNLNALKEEVARCEEIEKRNFSSRLSSVKKELESLWGKCFVLPTESMLPQIQENEISKTDLENYTNELTKWRKYYNDTKDIIQMIVKRQELWDQMLVFENKVADQNRFKNRGGNLLKEERERKKLQKVLPELEEKILVNIKNYEKDTGKQFQYYGGKFEDFIKRQWEDRLNQKENERLIKKKLRLEELRTPPFKKGFSAITPKSAPSKLLRTTGVSIFKTPNFSISRQTPHTISRLKKNEKTTGIIQKTPHTISCLKKNEKTTDVIQKTPHVISRLKKNEKTTDTIQKPKRNILKDKNNKLASKCLNSTTYAEFASKLNRSSRNHHQSTILSSKTIVGTRRSSNNNQRKKKKKSFQMK